ncbi:fumarylacetoacetate hydrolase family protein [Thermomicrobium sp. 4228-Ro]|uniref:2-keto-4-pentenoate hydratase n=1 Tax=Thermomicrobium sp. 4228-Ro TaxID=2993937 RepID=UPI00224951B9|nr:fumarylacetoacetate hydrolase family protein [Thermomicrobium sp. 4228-Ro]MCX2726609.1 fumarylacetoacetate hydrolase family protein [Thermomicrobium sp. 4228-Ro]
MAEHVVTLDTEAIAQQLEAALTTKRTIPPLTETLGPLTPEQAYAIQTRWTELRVQNGERIIGRKIGLTSRAMQEQLGVREPDYGSLWASRSFPASGGHVEIPMDLLIQPRVEGEIAFLLGRRLQGPGVTLQQVLAATEAVALSVEVVDSRIEAWRIKLADTIADDASFGAFTVGPWSRRLLHEDLRTVGMIIHQNGEVATEGIGAAALGHPARCVAWLANKLAEFGVALEPGDIVLSGSLARALPAERGDLFVVELHGQPPLTVRFV